MNLNKIALIRNSREGNFPDVQRFGELAIAAGANGLTVHPRPDQRHIRPADVMTLSALTQAHPQVEFNIEGNPFAGPQADYPGLIELVRASRPAQCTLVPDNDQQKTSDHGFDLNKDSAALSPIIHELHSLGVRVSLFMDPDPQQIALAKSIGADCIELYTGPFAWAYEQSEAEGLALFKQHCLAAEAAISHGLRINAGHDLNLANMQLYKQVPGLCEVSIGHALTVDSLLLGFDRAIKEYLRVCS